MCACVAAGACALLALAALLRARSGRRRRRRDTARLAGRTALVTGCNTGIGRETVLDLYKRGARVIMACRDVKKANEAKKCIENTCQGLQGVGCLVVLRLDLSSLQSVRECAEHILDTEARLHILVNNAGVMMCPEGRTKEGFETQFGTNHLGHFLLTLLLLPRIRSSAPARIVTVASLAHITLLRLNWDDLNSKRSYSSTQAYALSKTANILFSRELAKKLEEHRIKAVNTYSLHPGIIATDLGRNLSGALRPGLTWAWYNLWPSFAKTPAEGAETSLYCATDNRCAEETGLYYSDCAVAMPWTYSRSDANGKRMWETSVELVGLGDYNPFTAVDRGVKT